MRVTRSALCLLLALSLPPAGADIDERDIEPTGMPNPEFHEAVSGDGLQTEIVYLRPSAALPDPDGVAVPEAPGLPDPEIARRDWAIFLGVLLVLVILLVAFYGRGISVSFGAAARDPLRRARGEGAEVEAPAKLAPEAFLESVAAMPDRRRALVLLVGRALERAAEANGQRLGRSQTARDVLQALPPRWPHRETLRRLVFEAEIVHFGGRDLPEARWRACLESARPIFRAERAP